MSFTRTGRVAACLATLALIAAAATPASGQTHARTHAAVDQTHASVDQTHA